MLKVVVFGAVIAAGLLARLLARVLPSGTLPGDALWAPLRSRLAPLAIGLLSGAVVLLASPTRSLREIPRIQDEWAYLVQAQLFASGRWTGAARPVPDAFVEPLIVSPVLASKYPPGESLALTPGVSLGLPTLMPIVLTVVTGALLFGIVRLVAGEIVAALTVVYWLLSSQTLTWQSSYMSEVASGAAWIVACWALLRWVRGRRPVALMAVAAAVGAVAITRPLTAVAMAVPIAAIVLVCSARWKAWPALGAALLTGGAVVGVLALANARTTGSWHVLADDVYRRTYAPFDKLGFGLDSTPPLRPYTPDLDHQMDFYRAGHRAYVPSVVPRALWARARAIKADVWPGASVGLAPFAVLALIALPAEGWFAVATLASVVALYLLYWHPPLWSIYYLEVEPVLCFLTAFGVVRAVGYIAGPGRPLASTVLIPLAIGCAACIPLQVRQVRAMLRRDTAYYDRFNALLASLPSSGSIVFVQYGPHHDANRPLVRNPADLSRAPVWIVYDSGDAERRLCRIAPDRAFYRFDEGTWTLAPLFLAGHCAP